MTDLNPSFTSDVSATATTAENEVAASSLANGDSTMASTPPEDVSKFVVKTARPNSKLILQNMEEVLNSVKKKHRQKHRRKREQKKLAAQLEAESGVANGEGTTAAAMEQHRKAKCDKKHHHKRPKPKPLQEKTTQENGSGQHCSQDKHKRRKSPLKSNSPNGSILRHFPRTPKKDETAAERGATDPTEEENEVLVVEETDLSEDQGDREAEVTVQPTKPANAFEIMMNARNKSIGSNTPGKDAALSAEVKLESPTAYAKRKLLLQEWADKKGASKRKAEEEERAAYVEEQLDNRAKRLKQMLVGGKTTPSKTPSAVATSKQSKKTKTDERPRRRGRFSRRLSSSETVDSLTTNAATHDPETEEFLSKLSSPTKKRDSLLGYFPRKESPQETATTKLAKEDRHRSVNSPDVYDIPKIRGRRATKKAIAVPVENLDESVELSIESTETSNTPRGRPRRSCTGKARYDYDLDPSPTKLERAASKLLKTTAKENQFEVDIIDLDASNSSITPSPAKVPKKLAPVFVRSVPKPSPDPVALKARQDFLMSGVPEKMRLEMAKQKLYEQNYEEALEWFPRVCHVQQFSAEEVEFVNNRSTSLRWNIKIKEDLGDPDKTPLSSASKKAKGRKRQSGGKLTRKPPHSKSPIPVSTYLPLSTLENKRDIIKTWKQEFERFPTYKCYNQMREKYRYFSAFDSAQDTEQVSEWFMVTRRTRRSESKAASSDSTNEDTKPPATAPNGELLFTEKYKPLLLEQVLVNLAPVTQLRDFLAVWASGSGSVRNSQNLDDSMDEGNESSCSQSAGSNTVVLLGPVSSGKTNAVFALANDLNFNVLEINAGMKRTGKRLIQELQEATQSHQIRKDGASSMKAQKNLLKMSLNGSKYKRQNSQNFDSEGSSPDLTQNARKCLILIEDADVVFEQLDGGFIDAIYTLAASSKRPVIVVASNPNCPHLQRLMNQNTISFAAPNTLNISKFLAVLSLIENCPIRLDDLISLYTYNNRDLRRTLLEIQFFIQSGGDRERKLLLESQQRTPKKEDRASAEKETKFFASPTKQNLDAEAHAQKTQETDEQLASGNSQALSKSDECYMHCSLFEFYTGNQNAKWCVPAPVDFELLRVNLGNMLQVAPLLKLQQESQHEEILVKPANSTAAKRKSRSPKKEWLSSATGSSESVRTKRPLDTPLEALCNFYENASVAALLGAHDDLGPEIGCFDRLSPHLEEQIAHELVEKAINVDLGIETYPYNLCESHAARYSLSGLLGGNSLRGQSVCAVDFEPALRAICRSEKQRASQERRSTRFYHYLRHSLVNTCNFSTEPFDAACGILQETTSDESTTD